MFHDYPTMTKERGEGATQHVLTKGCKRIMRRVVRDTRQVQEILSTPQVTTLRGDNARLQVSRLGCLPLTKLQAWDVKLAASSSKWPRLFAP